VITKTMGIGNLGRDPEMRMTPAGAVRLGTPRGGLDHHQPVGLGRRRENAKDLKSVTGRRSWCEEEAPPKVEGVRTEKIGTP
jgi:hypothetical protein